MTRPRPHTRPAGEGRAGDWAAVRAVCFDVGGTLVVVDQGPTTGQVAQALGITLDDARAVMDAGPKRRRITPAELAEEIAEAFSRLQAISSIREVLETARTRAAAPPLFPDAAPVLRQLRACGFRVYALTNCLGSSVPEQEPEFHGLLDAVFCSADTGLCKPEREAFAQVEILSGLRPGQLLHVGDSARADVAGAVAAGWHAAYLHRPGDQRMPQAAEPLAITISTLHDLIPRLPVLT